MRAVRLFPQIIVLYSFDFEICGRVSDLCHWCFLCILKHSHLMLLTKPEAANGPPLLRTFGMGISLSYDPCPVNDVLRGLLTPFPFYLPFPEISLLCFNDCYS